MNAFRLFLFFTKFSLLLRHWPLFSYCICRVSRHHTSYFKVFYCCIEESHSVFCLENLGVFIKHNTKSELIKYLVLASYGCAFPSSLFVPCNSKRISVLFATICLHVYILFSCVAFVVIIVCVQRDIQNEDK